MTDSTIHREPLVKLYYANGYRLSDPLPQVVVAGCADAGAYCVHIDGAFHIMWQFQYIATAIMEAIALRENGTTIPACVAGIVDSQQYGAARVNPSLN